jgi:hypothetical protein
LDGGLESGWGRWSNADGAAKAIGGGEPESWDLSDQAVGIGTEYLRRLRAVDANQSGGKAGVEAVLREKGGHRAQSAMLDPGRGDRGGALAADTRYLADALRIGVEHLERLGAEGCNDSLGQHRPDLSDQTRAEVARDVFKIGRPLHLGRPWDETGAVASIDLPAALKHQHFARLDRWQRADHRDRLAPPAETQLDDAKAVLRVVEGDAIDRADQLGGGSVSGRLSRPHPSSTLFDHLFYCSVS